MKLAGLAAIGAAMAIATAAPAHADVDTDFNKHLQTFGIYGQKDYHAWIGKITCKRLHRGVDTDAQASAEFVSTNLPRSYDTQQAWRFLGAAIDFYCPDQRPVLMRAAEQPS
jgi:hypothetical protein